ncbi:MAG: hypothetical protein ACRD1K_10645 [Acidimicrobiales bacterium]
MASGPGAALVVLLLAPLVLTVGILVAVVVAARGTGVLVAVGVEGGTLVVRPVDCTRPGHCGGSSACRCRR